MNEQEKKQKQVKIILELLAADAKVKGIKGLAEYLCCPASRLYGWIRNGKIFDKGCVLTKFPDVRPEWLVDGTGPMLIDNQQQADQSEAEAVAVEAAAERVEAGEGEHVELFSQEDQPPVSKLLQMVAIVIEYDSVFRPALASNVVAFYMAIGSRSGRQAGSGRSSLSELLVMTSKILESRTVYSNALISNIVAFHQAVLGEIEMGKLRDEMAAIREQNIDIVARLAKIENAQQVTPEQPAKKREAI